MERTCRILDAKVVHRNKRARAYGTSFGDNPGKADIQCIHVTVSFSYNAGSMYLIFAQRCKKREYRRRTCTANAQANVFSRD